ncbi:hypothetical protein L7F22_063615 [Adiantum nelumboides]|nr:hypothetical protein [Adiantum nelumboides]
MRRSPFYPYPAYPFQSPLYAHDSPHHPQQQQYRRPSAPTSTPSQPPRSVINVPVFDSASPAPRPLSPPRTKSSVACSLDPVSAATRIQTCFRGYAIRRHHPLTHLRTISVSRKRLEDLKLELETPGFSNKVRSNERERLRFSESVMAIILQLDAIEGFVPEVRNQRKEVTKMAIKLQDAMDAILSLQEEEASPIVQGERPDQCNTINMVQEVTIQPDRARADQEAEGGQVQYGPLEVTDDWQDKPVKVVVSGDPCISCVGCVESVDCAETDPRGCQDATSVNVENIGVQSAIAKSTCSSEVGRDIASSKQLDQNIQEGIRCDMAGCNEELAAKPSMGCENVVNNPEKSIDICRETVEGLRQHPKPPCAEDMIDVDRLNSNVSCLVGDKLLNTQQQVLDSSDKVQGATSAGNNVASQAARQEDDDDLSREKALPQADSVLLKKLSEECGQLKILLGKLLAQSKAQSKVICALGDRLEILEQQQQLGCQNSQQQRAERGKRKLKKGSKRSAR